MKLPCASQTVGASSTVLSIPQWDFWWEVPRIVLPIRCSFEAGPACGLSHLLFVLGMKPFMCNYKILPPDCAGWDSWLVLRCLVHAWQLVCYFRAIGPKGDAHLWLKRSGCAASASFRRTEPPVNLQKALLKRQYQSFYFLFLKWRTSALLTNLLQLDDAHVTMEILFHQKKRVLCSLAL